MYFEDLDLSLRMHQAGHRSRFIVEARCHHVGGGTSRQVKGKRLAYSLRSRMRYAAKHYPRLAAAAVAAASVTVEPWVRLLASATGHGDTGVWAIIEGYLLLAKDHLRASNDP